MGRQSDSDGSILRCYSIRCGMPDCTNFRAVNDNVVEGNATKRKAIKKLRSEGWSNRDVLGWTCGQHDGHERRKAKREQKAPSASEYGLRHA